MVKVGTIWDPKIGHNPTIPKSRFLAKCANLHLYNLWGAAVDMKGIMTMSLK